MDAPRDILIYDGDCAFCTYWVRYWQKLTEGRVRFAPYQQVASSYPEISADEFRAAVQYITPQREIARGAEATFLTLSHAPARGFWLELYRTVPGFAWLSERVYNFIARRRDWFYRPTLLLWGKELSPPRYEFTSWLLLRLLGLIFLAAFVSLGVQALGLIGHEGILPLPQLLPWLKQNFGSTAYWHLPMVFWLNASDAAIQAVCWAGAAFAILLVLNIMPRLSLVLLYMLYLSLLYAGQTFMSFQWDVLLIEAGVLALVLTLWPTLGIWLLRWLMFRFMFMSGVVKLAGGDPHWRDFTALQFHFFTQPLPTPLAWYAQQLPDAFLTLATVLMLVIETVLPFFIFLPRRLRFVAAFGFLLLQTCILLTGNYTFFNLLALALCVPLFDDAAFGKLNLRKRAAQRTRGPVLEGTLLAFAIYVVVIGGAQVMGTFSRGQERWTSTLNVLEPLSLVNPYGPFSKMTAARPEIIVEGSADGVRWREYVFKYKPGPLKRPPLWNIPHQPRLDWQMWLAALSIAPEQPWFEAFMRRLLEGSPQVVALLARNPFAEARPKYVRAMLYDYRFTTPRERAASGRWWERELVGMYYPPTVLKPPRSHTPTGRGLLDSILRPN
jgi:predicted DCC family thiol-disulfide oxidoreductase YuxK